MTTALERLIGACVDDQRLLTQGERLDTTRRVALKRLADERGMFINELRVAGKTLKKTPRARRSMSGIFRNLLMDANMLAVGVNAGDIVSACRNSQGRLEARFEAAMKKKWSHEIDVLLVEQHTKICGAHAVLTGLF